MVANAFVFPIPVPVSVQEQPDPPTFGSGLAFDLDLGDFILTADGDLLQADGEETWKLWCVNTVVTQRRAWLIYSPGYGTDLEAIQQQPDVSLQEFVLVREITAALMANRQTARVSGFVFSRDGEDVACTFEVTSQAGTVVTVPLTIS